MWPSEIVEMNRGDVGVLRRVHPTVSRDVPGVPGVEAKTVTGACHSEGMEAFALILALLMLLTGAVTGAAVVYVLLRRRYLAVEQDFDGVSARLSEVSAQFAAADAERRLLAAQNRELGESRNQDGSVLRALAPGGGKAHRRAAAGIPARTRPAGAVRPAGPATAGGPPVR